MPLASDRSPVAANRAWILPVLKAASKTSPCTLAHFRDGILPMVAHFEALLASLPPAQAAARHGARARIVQVFQLCSWP